MCYEHQWGTVCDDYWGTNDAIVACRQLGFSFYGMFFMIVIPNNVRLSMDLNFHLGAIAYSNAIFGRGSGHILLDNVGCTGGELRLLDCSSSGVGVYSSNCGHDDDAGVSCTGRWSSCSKINGCKMLQ